MYKITIEDYRYFLSFCIKKPDSYVSYINGVLSKEKIGFSELVDCISYYIYKYKFFSIEGISKHTQKNYLTALNWLDKLSNPKTKRLTFKIETNEDFSYKSFKKLRENIEVLNKKYKLDFEDENIIKIESFKKGSLILSLIFASVFSFEIVKIMKFIKELCDAKKSGEFKGKKATKAIIHSALLLLEVADLLMTFGNVTLCVEHQLSIKLVQGLLDFLLNL